MGGKPLAGSAPASMIFATTVSAVSARLMVNLPTSPVSAAQHDGNGRLARFRGECGADSQRSSRNYVQVL